MEKWEEARRKCLEEGGVHALLYFQVGGKDLEKAKAVLLERTQRITTYPGVKLGTATLERDEEGWIAEVRLLVDFPALLQLVLLFSPVSVEVLEPSEVRLPLDKANEVLMRAASISYSLAALSLSAVRKDPEYLAKLKENLEKRIKRTKELLGRGDDRDKRT